MEDLAVTDKTTPERQPGADALPPLPASQAFSLTLHVMRGKSRGAAGWRLIP